MIPSHVGCWRGSRILSVGLGVAEDGGGVRSRGLVDAAGVLADDRNATLAAGVDANGLNLLHQ